MCVREQHLRGEYNLHRLKIFLPDDELQVLSNAANMPMRLMSSVSVALSFLVLDAPDDGQGEPQYFWAQCQLHIDVSLREASGSPKRWMPCAHCPRVCVCPRDSMRRCLCACVSRPQPGG